MSKVRTLHSRDYPVGHDYDGLRRALENEFELLGRHEVAIADYHQLSPDGALYRLHLREGTLAKLTPPITDGWLVEPAAGSPRARVLSVDEDEDRLFVRCTAPRPGSGFAGKLRLTQPDFRFRLREWLSLCQGRGFPPLLEQLKAQTIQALGDATLGIPAPDLAVLRPAQQTALARAVPGLTYLWGPPGTGKTFTLARMLQSLVARGYKVALIAPTNVAVDTAVLAVYRAYLTSGTELPGGFLVRAGHPVLTELDDYPALLAWQQALRAQQLQMTRLTQRQREVQRNLTLAKGSERQELLKMQAELKGEVEDCQMERGQMLWRLAAEANILATTVHGALHQQELLAFLSAPKVALVIDEAGMVPRFATLPLLEVLGGGEGLQQGRLIEAPAEVAMILAGDPRQLGPIHRQVNERDVNMRHWLGESLMEELLEAAPPGDHRTFLDQQSRMDESICQRISRTYYQGQLRTVPDPARPTPPLVDGWPEDGVVVLDPKRLPLPWDAPTENWLSADTKSNERNLWIAVSLIRQALACGRARSVLWLTPFREQAFMARKMRDGLFSDVNVRVGTVHASQGGEADMVLFDPVNIGHRWLMGRMGSELDIERMLNVAISRARGQALVFATPQQLAKNDLFRRLLGDAAVWVAKS